ncbi:MAG: NADH-quinone oxidoreductase subunit N [Acidimicrobiales bacterium]
MTGLSGLMMVVSGGSFAVPRIDYTALLPELILIGGALVLLAAGALRVRQLPTAFYSVASGATGVAALVAGIVLWDKIHGHGRPFTAVAQSLAIDGFSTAFVILAACVIIVSSLIADGYLRREQIVGPEYHALGLLGASGAMLMAAANDFIVIFLGLEIMSIPLYILAALDQRREESGEAGMKYFVLGAFSSAIFVYGIALTYGATGSTNLAQIAAYLSSNVTTNDGLLLAGTGLLLVGFLFKVAAVPFHMWTPDVYEGAPSPATGFMAAIAKVGGFAALLRVFFSSFHSLEASWQPILWVVAVLTLVTGAVLGLVQRDIKRMLAYSSINHAGFILLGLQAASAEGISASLYYVFVYAFLVLGSFAVVTVVSGRGDQDHGIESYRGFGRRQPVLALGFAVLLLAQAGAPFTTGFLGKLYVVEAAVRAHSYALAAVAMLTGAVAAGFYLRVVFLMYGAASPTSASGQFAPAEGADVAGGPARQPGALVGPGSTMTTSFPEVGVSLARATLLAAPPGEPRMPGEQPSLSTATAGDKRGPVELAPATAIGLLITVGVTIVFGLWPGPLFDFAHAASLLFH